MASAPSPRWSWPPREGERGCSDWVSGWNLTKYAKILWVGGQYMHATPVAWIFSRTADLRLWRSIQLATVKETTILQHPLFNLSFPTVPFRPQMKRSQRSWWGLGTSQRNPDSWCFMPWTLWLEKNGVAQILSTTSCHWHMHWCRCCTWWNCVGLIRSDVTITRWLQSRQVASNGWCRVLKCGHFRRTSYTSIFYQWCFSPNNTSYRILASNRNALPIGTASKSWNERRLCLLPVSAVYAGLIASFQAWHAPAMQPGSSPSLHDM